MKAAVAFVSTESSSLAGAMAEKPKEEEKVQPPSDVVKTEPKEDADAPPRKKRDRQRKGDAEKKEDPGALKRKKDEDGEEDDVDEVGNEEDAMAPEAEPTHPRTEVEPGNKKFREDAVHVYGLDFLKTGHMEEIFSQFNHRYVEWINDSSANVVFRDAASALKALESLSYPKAGDDPWRRTPDILVHDDLPAIFLQMRLAAPSDNKAKKKCVPSMNPPKFVEESDRRNPNFTVASLYETRKEKTQTGKRAAQVLPAEEAEKRQRRASRFVDTLADPVEESKADETEPVEPKPTETLESAAKGKVDEDKKAPTEEEAAEEVARRQKRALRFGTAESSEAKPAETSASGEEKAPETSAEVVAAPADRKSVV